MLVATIASQVRRKVLRQPRAGSSLGRVARRDSVFSLATMLDFGRRLMRDRAAGFLLRGFYFDPPQRTSLTLEVATTCEGFASPFIESDAYPRMGSSAFILEDRRIPCGTADGVVHR